MNPELLEISNPLSGLEQQGQSLLANPWLWLGIFILVLVFLVLIFIRYYLKKIFRLKYAFEKVVLLVTLPKERPQDEAQKKGIKEMGNPGQLIIHFNNDKKPQKVELVRVDIKEIW